MKKLLLVSLVLGLALPALAVDIVASDDTTVRGTTNYNASSPFGLFVKYSGDQSYIEFTLGTVVATEAKLVLDNNYGPASSSWDVGLKATELDFDQATYTGADTSGWAGIGTIFGVLDVGLYEVDLTSWYNANLGKTMTINMSTANSPTNMASGPIFEDIEGTVAGGAAPTLVVVPEPATLLLLSAGLGALVRRRRKS